MTLAGEDCPSTARGMFLVTTNSASPYAKGKTYGDDESRDETKSLRQSRDALNIQAETVAGLREQLDFEDIHDYDDVYLARLLGVDKKLIPRVELIKVTEN